MQAQVIFKDKLQELSNELRKGRKLESTSKSAQKEALCKPQSTENLMNAYELALIKTKMIHKF